MIREHLINLAHSQRYKKKLKSVRYWYTFFCFLGGWGWWWGELHLPMSMHTKGTSLNTWIIYHRRALKCRVDFLGLPLKKKRRSICCITHFKVSISCTEAMTRTDSQDAGPAAEPPCVETSCRSLQISSAGPFQICPWPWICNWSRRSLQSDQYCTMWAEKAVYMVGSAGVKRMTKMWTP